MVRCSSCQKDLKLITGHATIRLYRCDGCGAQQLLPGDPSFPAVAEAASAHALIAGHPSKRGGLPASVMFAVIALVLGILLLLVVVL